MIIPRLERLEDGVAFDDLAPAFIMLLMELPELLGPDQPDPVKRRLFPDAAGNEETKDEWRRLVHPELFALLASARGIVTKDLAGLKPSGADPDLGTWRLEIPAAHVTGWISALNAGRLALGAVHEIENADDMHPAFDVGDPDGELELDALHVAVVKIHLLGELQAMLIMDHHPSPEIDPSDFDDYFDHDDDDDENDDESG